jgi:hypothetical protein
VWLPQGKDDEEAGGQMMARKEYFDYVSETIATFNDMDA